MTNGWYVGKFGDVLEPVSRPVQVEADKVYKNLGVQWYAYGLFIREEKPGHEIRAKELYKVELGDLVYNRLFAWKGSFAIADKNTAGGFVSGEFPCFRVDTNRANAKFLHLYLSQEKVWEEIERTSTGQTSISRLRLKEPVFLSMDVPLPPLDEQNRIVERVEALSTRIAKAQSLQMDSNKQTELLAQQAIWKVFADGEKENKHIKRLGSICEFQGGSQPPKSFFAYEALEGYVRLIQIRDYKSDNYLTYVSKEAVTRFCTADDIMIGRYGPPVFQILRGIEGAYNVAIMKTVPDETVLSKSFLYYLLQEPIFHKKVVDDSQRSSGQTGIRKELLQDHMTYVPPLDEQQRIVAYLDSVQARLASLRELQSATGEELDALLPSVLDRAFKGEL